MMFCNFSDVLLEVPYNPSLIFILKIIIVRFFKISSAENKLRIKAWIIFKGLL